MTPLEITLCVILYIVLFIVSIKPFKYLSKKNELDQPVIASFFFPLIWLVFTGIAIYEGYKKIFDIK